MNRRLVTTAKEYLSIGYGQEVWKKKLLRWMNG